MVVLMSNASTVFIVVWLRLGVLTPGIIHSHQARAIVDQLQTKLVNHKTLLCLVHFSLDVRSYGTQQAATFSIAKFGDNGMLSLLKNAY